MSVDQASAVDEILARNENAARDKLIPILQQVQEVVGYISRDAVIRIGQTLRLPTSKIYGVATFYNQFRFQPQGKSHIQICRGTACHVKGSLAVMEAFQRELGVTPGETTKDGQFSFEVVACIGACGLAPVITVDGEFHARVTPEGVKDILAQSQNKADSK